MKKTTIRGPQVFKNFFQLLIFFKSSYLFAQWKKDAWGKKVSEIFWRNLQHARKGLRAWKSRPHRERTCCTVALRASRIVPIRCGPWMLSIECQRYRTSPRRCGVTKPMCWIVVEQLHTVEVTTLPPIIMEVEHGSLHKFLFIEGNFSTSKIMWRNGMHFEVMIWKHMISNYGKRIGFRCISDVLLGNVELSTRPSCDQMSTKCMGLANPAWWFDGLC